jgi:coatomer subunit alpha
LAYLTAKTNGLDEVAQEILYEKGLDESDIEDIPSFGQSSLKPPPIVTPISQLNWPLLPTSQSFFEKALVNGHIEGEYVNGIEDADGAIDDWMREDQAVEEDAEEEDAAGWDLDTGEIEAQIDVGEEVAEADGEAGAGAAPGVSETEMWVRNSPFAADHAAAGSFETAMQVC